MVREYSSDFTNKLPNKFKLGDHSLHLDEKPFIDNIVLGWGLDIEIDLDDDPNIVSTVNLNGLDRQKLAIDRWIGDGKEKEWSK